jgi:hypothetical protein
MMKKKKSYLDNLYNYESNDNSYEISLSLKNYEEVFNPYDYSQFRKRDLDNDFFNYLLECSREIPLNYNIKLAIYISENNMDNDKSKNLVKAIKNNIYWEEKINNKKIKSGLKYCLLFLIIGIICFSVSAILDNFNINYNLLLNLLYNSAILVAWVFLWKMMEMLVFDLNAINRENRYLKRLLKSKIEVRTY